MTNACWRLKPKPQSGYSTWGIHLGSHNAYSLNYSVGYKEYVAKYSSVE